MKVLWKERLLISYGKEIKKKGWLQIETFGLLTYDLKVVYLYENKGQKTWQMDRTTAQGAKTKQSAIGVPCSFEHNGTDNLWLDLNFMRAMFLYSQCSF